MILGARHRAAAAVTSAAGLAAVLLAWFAVGADGPPSAALGAAMVLGFFGAGALPFLVAGDGSRSALAFLVLAMTYVLRILLGVVLYALASEASWVHSRTVGLTVIGCALVWTGTQVVLGLSRSRQPTLEV